MINRKKNNSKFFNKKEDKNSNVKLLKIKDENQLIKEDLDGLDERKKQILKEVIDQYINTAEPVSSSDLMEKFNLSSATLRNELAILEGKGYLDKTHTSSGRIPSEKGYRYYVNELIKEDDISLEEIKYIQEQLSRKINEIEDLTKITTTTLSDITHYTTVAIGPKAQEQTIEEIKFVLLGSRMLMIVIMVSNGMVKETIIKYDEDIAQTQVNSLNSIFNAKLKGKPLSKIDKPMAEYIFSELEYSINVIKPIIEQINYIIEQEQTPLLKGASKSFDLPEFKSMEVARNFVSVLDSNTIAEEILNSSGVAKDINVYIGNENSNEELKDFSVVTFKHKVGNKDLGTIGIIGPKRMNYSKVISVMKYISKKLNEKEDEIEDNNKKLNK